MRRGRLLDPGPREQPCRGKEVGTWGNREKGGWSGESEPAHVGQASRALSSGALKTMHRNQGGCWNKVGPG